MGEKLAAFDPPRYISPAEAAAILGVRRDTLYRWIYGGQVRAARFGGRWKVSRASVAAFITDAVQEENTTPPQANHQPQDQRRARTHTPAAGGSRQ